MTPSQRANNQPTKQTNNPTNHRIMVFMGGLSLYMPFIFSRLMVSEFALCGMPFLAGVYSKDFILEIFL
jgi:NADH-ubiquinone oxidoreductase chain 5